MDLAGPSRYSEGSANPDTSSRRAFVSSLRVKLSGFSDMRGYTEYCVISSGASSIVSEAYHRYSAFAKLHDELGGRLVSGPFPVPKLYYHSRRQKRERANALMLYLTSLLSKARSEALVNGDAWEGLPPALLRFLCIPIQTPPARQNPPDAGGYAVPPLRRIQTANEPAAVQAQAPAMRRTISGCATSNGLSSDRVLLARSRLENGLLRQLVTKLRRDVSELHVRWLDRALPTEDEGGEGGEGGGGNAAYNSLRKRCVRFSLLHCVLRIVNRRLREENASLRVQCASAADAALLDGTEDEPSAEETAENIAMFESLYAQLVASHAAGVAETQKLMPKMLTELARMPDEALRTQMMRQFAILAGEVGTTRSCWASHAGTLCPSVRRPLRRLLPSSCSYTLTLHARIVPRAESSRGTGAAVCDRHCEYTC